MTTDTIEKKLDKVRESYILSLAEKRVSIQTLWQKLLTDWQTPVFNELYIVIHSMAGSAGTFNLEKITQCARIVVELFKENKSNEIKPDDALLQTIDSELDKLLIIIAQTK